ncbi:MAG TPA: SUMF1/EgtB/PvdO family nonheme iron enzyme [Thermoanaerobaculia bacterium]|nr:SUMF1/EgtB/PvdO family nonheme iron enzyme [Thermoanaerobaculia bacterium]
MSGHEQGEPAPERPSWIVVDLGEFVMGGGPRVEENPPHPVRVPAFELARTPVTRADYQRFLDATGHAEPPFWREEAFGHPRMPAVGPSWEDATTYCAWFSELLSERLGGLVRLPSEAEWECAAKAERNVIYPWGDEPPESLPDYASRWLEGPEPVDAYPSRHPLGFLGLAENVHEWCSDWYDPAYYSRSPAIDPRGPERGHRRSARGGSWRHAIKVSRCAARSSIPPEMRYSDFGFRLARDADNGGRSR